MAKEATDDATPQDIRGLDGERTLMWLRENYRGNNLNEVIANATKLGLDGDTLCNAQKEDLVNDLGMSGIHASSILKIRAVSSGDEDVVTILHRVEGKLERVEDKLNRLMNYDDFDEYAATTSSIVDDVNAALESHQGRVCCVTGAQSQDAPRWWPHSRQTPFVKAAHLYPQNGVCRSKANAIHGVDAGFNSFEIDSERNILPLRFDLELGWDRKQLVLAPLGLTFKDYQVQQVNADALEELKEEMSKRLHQQRKGGRESSFLHAEYNDIFSRWDRLQVEFPSDARPYRRVIGRHMGKVAKMARQQGWNLCPGVDLDALEATSRILREASLPPPDDAPDDEKRE